MFPNKKQLTSSLISSSPTLSEIEVEGLDDRCMGVINGVVLSIRDLSQDFRNQMGNNYTYVQMVFSLVSHLSGDSFGDQEGNPITWEKARKMIAARSGQQHSEEEFDIILTAIRDYFRKRQPHELWVTFGQYSA